MLHSIAFGCLLPVVGQLWKGALVPSGAPWALPVVGLLVATAGALLYLEQRWAEDVSLAFFKVNVYIGFVVLGVVLVTRLESGGYF